MQFIETFAIFQDLELVDDVTGTRLEAVVEPETTDTIYRISGTYY